MGEQCLLTVESGFVHAQIISGVSVPLGLWKPSLATINRSAGRKLTLVGGRPSPPQSRDRTGSKSVSSVPNTSACNKRVGVWLHFFLKPCV